MEAGYIKTDLNVDELSLMLWSQVHGLVSLHNKERLNIYNVTDQKEFMFRTYETFFQLMKKSLA